MFGKELYRRLKKAAIHGDEVCPPASVTIAEAFPDANHTPREAKQVVAELPKWQGKEPIDGKLTQLKNQLEVPQKRSERSPQFRNNGRYYHAPWPHDRKPKATRPVNTQQAPAL